MTRHGNEPSAVSDIPCQPAATVRSVTSAGSTTASTVRLVTGARVP